MTPTPARPCPGSPVCLTDVVVIGAGALGAAAAWWLARAGTAVLLLEEGTGRQLRSAARGTAWSAHPSWVAGGGSLLAAAAWREVERETGAALLTRGDALDHGDPDLLAAAVGAAAGTWLDPAAAAARRPGAAFTGPVLLRRGAALQVRADHAVAALTAGAVGRGAVVRYRSPVSTIDVLDDQRVEVRTAAGRIRARRVIVTSVVPSAVRGVELHFASRHPAPPGTALVARHDAALGLVRAVPCAQGHVAVGAGTWPHGTVGDLRDHVRTWFPELDLHRPEPVGPEAMSTGPAEVSVRRSGPVLTATSSALGSVDVVLRGRELAGQARTGREDRPQVVTAPA